MENKKICRTCKKEYPLDYFYKVHKNRECRRPECKYCYQAWNKKYRDRNIEKYRASWRKASKKLYYKDPFGIKLRQNYGITIDQYSEMVNKQDGRCKICHEKPDLLAVDHCHKRNKVRALLCLKCNSGLGMFKENVDVLKRAIQYLLEYANM